MFLLSRLAVGLVVLAALASFPPARCEFCVDLSAVPLLAGLARWDSAGYLAIAEQGYGVPGRETLAAYFPAYPLLMRAGGAPLGGSADAYLAAGILVANLALLVAAVALFRLAAARLDERAGERAAVYLLLFPTTVFLSAVYADALFLAFAVTSALAAERQRWWRAGWLAAGAALTRPFGGLALLPLVVGLWRSRGVARRRDLLAVLLAPMAFALWIAYLYAVTGNPLAVLHGYTSGFEPRGPMQAFVDLFDPSVYGFPWFVAGLFALFVVLVTLTWRVAGVGLALYATAMLVLLVLAGSLTSSMRYELSIYPAFVALAWLTRSRWAHVLWASASGALALVFTAMYALYLWVG